MAAEVRAMRRVPVFAMMSLVCLAVVVVNGVVVYTLIAPHAHEPAIERGAAGALQAIALSSAGALAALMLFAQRLPDLVMLDLMLPKVPGLEVLRAIRAQLPDVSVS